MGISMAYIDEEKVRQAARVCGKYCDESTGDFVSALAVVTDQQQNFRILTEARLGFASRERMSLFVVWLLLER